MKKTLKVFAIALALIALACANAFADDFVLVDDGETIELEQALVETDIPDAENANTARVFEFYNGPRARGTAVLRQAPDGMSKVVVSMGSGAHLELLAIEGDWALVSTTNGMIGYVYRDQLSGVDFAPITDGMEVLIFTDCGTTVAPGQIITLTSKLVGMDGLNVTYQWEVDFGNGYTAITGANGDSYSFAASMETLNCSYRLTVYFE